MDIKEDNVIGIVGGMGPMAGVALLNNILVHTDANEDQQHLSAILMSFPKHIVDRTCFLEGNLNTNPAFSIVNIIAKLEIAGAKIVGIACNTSHSPDIYDVILEELSRRDSKVKLLHMPFEACRYIKDNYTTVRRIGLMTTNGTYRTAVYKNLLTELGYEVIIPDFDFQNNTIHKMIYDKTFGLKANANIITSEALILLNESLQFFKRRKTDAIILGCTELSLILTEKMVDDMLIVDSTKTLAQALIREAIVSGQSKNNVEDVLLAIPEEY